MKLAAKHIKKAIDCGAWIARRDGVRVVSDELTINPNSVNVSLGDVALYARVTGKHGYVDLHDPASLEWERVEADVFYIKPGDFLLMSVRERFECKKPLVINDVMTKFVPMIDGRSTPGRCGLTIHRTAGFGDYGFNSNFTLEVSAKLPIILRRGDEIGQVYFDDTTDGDDEYNGAYCDQHDEPRAPLLGRDRFQRF